MCDCISYNRPDLGGSKVSVVRRGISLDPCIADQIEALWDAGIETVHSCCGHNGAFGPASVGVLKSNDYLRAISILLKDRKRPWRVFVDINVKEPE